MNAKTIAPPLTTTPRNRLRLSLDRFGLPRFEASTICRRTIRTSIRFVR